MSKASAATAPSVARAAPASPDETIMPDDGAKSELPAGVQMHDAAMPPKPMTYDEAAVDTRVRKDPPPGWQGSYMRCGGCGDFMTADVCARCSSTVQA